MKQSHPWIPEERDCFATLAMTTDIGLAQLPEGAACWGAGGDGDWLPLPGSAGVAGDGYSTGAVP